MKSATRITQLNIIQPKKCIIEDFEILAFENEEEFKYYTLWHEALADKKRGITSNSDDCLQQPTTSTSSVTLPQIPAKSNKKPSTSERLKDGASRLNKPQAAQVTNLHRLGSPTPEETRSSSTPIQRSLNNRKQLLNDYQTPNATNRAIELDPIRPPDGLTVLNPVQPHGLNVKYVSKYKLTKLYNKLRGRQERRNYVIEKQKATKIETEYSKSFLNTWTSYTALQALRLPESKVNQLSAATTNGGKFLTHMPPQIQQPIQMINGTGKKVKSPSKKSKLSILQQQLQPQKPPMHLIYIDPGNIITYSNRINPQQIIDYRKKPPIQPSSATSKRSSAASYDVYEIMEVLANTNKTNVTITRNANRPTQNSNSNPSSIYSHSVNVNTPGIVSTQLHLQAKSYLDLMRKFYEEEKVRLEEDKQNMMSEPSVEEVISNYLKNTRENSANRATSFDKPENISSIKIEGDIASL